MMGRRIRIKKLIAILLCITSVIVLCMPLNTSYASVQVGDFTVEGDVLVKYTGSEENLTVLGGVTAIGKEAFSGNTKLKKVILPDSVKKIDFAAFEDCKELIQVVIPQGVKEIGSSAFSGCENLKYVNIPAKCEKIGSAAFAKCNRLSDISVAETNPSYICVDGVLYTADGTELVQYLAGRPSSSYSMPSSVKNIKEYAFWGASQLADLSISSSVKEIPEYAFANCVGLVNVVLPYSVESLMAYSFSDCDNLTNVVLPETTGYIDSNAFYLTYDVELDYYDPEAAKKIIDEAGITQESFDEYVEGVTRNDYSIFVSGSAGEKAYLSEMEYTSTDTANKGNTQQGGELASAKISGGEAFLMMPRDVNVRGYDIGGADGEDRSGPVYTDPYIASTCNIAGNVLAGYNGSDEIPQLPSGIGRIGNRAFYMNPTVREIDIPAGVRDIGDFAFARSALQKVSIPEGTERIGYAAFYNCGLLSDVDIPSSVKSIELGAFNGSRWYDELMKRGGESDFVVVGDGILIGYKGKGGSVSVPAGVKTIGSGCFSGNNGITEVILPQGLRVIGEEAFMGCGGLKEISFPDSVTDIEDRAFKNSGLKQVIIPEGIKNIGIGAFDRTETVSPEDRRGAVVFLGNELPRVNYKNTATRLSATDLRTPAFAGYENAIIGSDVSIDEGSVLSPQEYGFRGQVYIITSDASADTGELRLISSFSEPQDGDGNVVIDPHVTLNGKNYIMSGVNDNAFDSYRTGTGSKIGYVKNVSIEGNTSPELSARLEELSAALKNNPIDTKSGKDGGSWNVINTQTDSDISPDKDGAYAYITGDNGSYHMKISAADDRENVCNAAFINKYGSMSGITMVPLDISMYEDKSGVSIKRLSGKNVDIELPIPTKLISESNIMVGAINDNNELETIPSQIINHGGNDKLKFVASHFSTFVVYTSLEQTSVLNTENEQNLSLPVQSAVVGTLNRNVGSFSLRFYVAAVLLSLAGILVVLDISGRSRREKEKNKDKHTE
jgi:hypothetical protein